MTKFRIFENLRITTKFILWFLVITLIPLSIATYVSYNNSRKILKEEATKRLFAVADNKANQIEAYFNEKEKNVSQLLLMPTFTSAIESLKEALDKDGIDSQEYKKVNQKFRPFFTYYQELFEYDDLLLVSSDGEVILSAKDKKYTKSLYKMAAKGNSELADIFVKTSKDLSLKTNISNFEYLPETDKAFVFIAAPVLSERDLIGVLIAKMDNQGISKLVQDYRTLGKTGEAMVAAEIDDKSVLITPLRFGSSVPKEEVVDQLKKGLCIKEMFCWRGESTISYDYRKREVLAIWKYLPSCRLGMIVKMDTVEIFASAKELRNVLLMTSLLLLAVVMVMAILIARSVSSPIKELTRISAIITSGDLSERANIDTKDEIGELARSFNAMTDSLIEAKANVEQERSKLEEQKKLLEKANQELDGFVYTASHDLRAPLRAISSFSSFLEEDYKNKLDEEGRGHLSEIRKGANQMDRLINDLLTLSRISRVRNPYEDIKIKELINSIVERIKFDIEKNKADLKIQEDMPIVRCDRIKIGELFLNLINNAIKFSSKNNKKSPKVEIGYTDKNDFHEFYVKDNGIGIAPQHHEEIFGIFKRLDTAQKFEGTGAGLSIVKRVVDDCGGKIWVESELGKGAIFYFTIPKGLKKKTFRKIIAMDGSISEEELANDD